MNGDQLETKLRELVEAMRQSADFSGDSTEFVAETFLNRYADDLEDLLAERVARRRHPAGKRRGTVS